MRFSYLFWLFLNEDIEFEWVNTNIKKVQEEDLLHYAIKP